MTWIDRVMNSDAGRGNPEFARELIKAVESKEIPAPQEWAEVAPEVIKEEFSS